MSKQAIYCLNFQKLAPSCLNAPAWCTYTMASKLHRQKVTATGTYKKLPGCIIAHKTDFFLHFCIFLTIMFLLRICFYSVNWVWRIRTACSMNWTQWWISNYLLGPNLSKLHKYRFGPTFISPIESCIKWHVFFNYFPFNITIWMYINM